jgi:hypothetical protein
MKLSFWRLLVTMGLLVTATHAYAGEGLFSRAYTTETVPAGHFELEETVRDREVRSFGHYRATDFRTELVRRPRRP